MASPSIDGNTYRWPLPYIGLCHEGTLGLAIIVGREDMLSEVHAVVVEKSGAIARRQLNIDQEASRDSAI